MDVSYRLQSLHHRSEILLDLLDDHIAFSNIWLAWNMFKHA